MRRKVVGILGGMGPEATADLFSKIVRSTPARRDQDHLRVIVDSLPQIPDRTAAILGQGESPGPVLRAAARRLESWGAEVIVIPCNTAHYYHGDIAAAVSVPVLHIMEQTARAITSAHPEVRKVGILASTGTLNAGLYRRALEAVGLTELCPPPDVQEDVMAAIYGVKAGEYDRPHRLLAAPSGLEDGARVVLAWTVGRHVGGKPRRTPCEVARRQAEQTPDQRHQEQESTDVGRDRIAGQAKHVGGAKPAVHHWPARPQRHPPERQLEPFGGKAPLHVTGSIKGKMDTTVPPAFLFTPSAETAAGLGAGFICLTILLSILLPLLAPLGAIYLVSVIAAGVYALSRGLMLSRDARNREKGLKAFASLSIFRLIISAAILTSVLVS